MDGCPVKTEVVFCNVLPSLDQLTLCSRALDQSSTSTYRITQWHFDESIVSLPPIPILFHPCFHDQGLHVLNHVQVFLYTDRHVNAEALNPFKDTGYLVSFGLFVPFIPLFPVVPH